MKRFSLPVAFVLFFGVLLAAPAQATGELTANGMACTVVGTNGDDVLVGTLGDDIMCGLGGDDEIDAGAGDDVVDGGSGDDFIELDSGDDYSFGGPGADKLFGGDGRDALLGGNDNDSLLGGAGVDDLDGEAGVNWCDTGAGESTERCFFDQGGPKLISMAVVNPTVDTSKSDQIFVLRARIDDEGTGVAGFGIQFDPHNFDGGRPLGFNGGSFTEEACSGSGASDPDPNNRTVRSSYCLISGDRFSGVYEIKVRVPRYTPKMSWKVNSFGGFDFAGNQSDYNTEDIKEKGLMLTIKQKGKGDSFKPTLGAVAVMTKSINTQNNNAIVNIRFAFKDKGVGVKNFQGSFVMGNDFDKKIEFNYESYSSLNSCVNGLAPDPTIPGSSSSCLMAGNELGGVIDYKVMIRKLTPQGTYKLDSMIVFDEGGNNSWYGDSKLAKNQKASIKQVGKGDGSAPKITSIKVLTPKVSTGSGSVEVRIQVKAKDNLAGINQLGVGFSRKLGKSSSYINFSFSVTDQNCGPDGRAAFPTSGFSGTGYSTGCLVSGTLNDGVFEIITKLPANAAKAKYVVDGISAEDSAGNGGGTPTKKFSKVTITNG